MEYEKDMVMSELNEEDAKFISTIKKSDPRCSLAAKALCKKLRHKKLTDVFSLIDRQCGYVGEIDDFANALVEQYDLGVDAKYVAKLCQRFGKKIQVFSFIKMMHFLQQNEILFN